MRRKAGRRVARKKSKRSRKPVGVVASLMVARDPNLYECAYCQTKQEVQKFPVMCRKCCATLTGECKGMTVQELADNAKRNGFALKISFERMPGPKYSLAT